MKNLAKVIKVFAITGMAILGALALAYAIYLATWGIYLYAALVVVASGIFAIGGFALLGLARVIENTDKLVANAKKETEEKQQ